MQIMLKAISLQRLLAAFVRFCICSTLSALPADAQGTIDFETVPGGSPADQLAIASQYLADFGVTFSLEGGGTPFLEARGLGDSGHGFYNFVLDTFDIESASNSGELGDYFLRFGTTTFSAAPGPVLVIMYANPVSATSAEIWDLDAASGGTNGYEAWTLSARDINDVVIDTIVSPNGIGEDLPSSMNGKPWKWSFDRPNADIHSITVQFTGTAIVVGLAFDNFSPAGAPQVPIGPWAAPVLDHSSPCWAQLACDLAELWRGVARPS